LLVAIIIIIISIITVASPTSSSVSMVMDTAFSGTQPWPWMCVRSESVHASDVSSWM
jgi:hypothetical protein